MNKNNKLNEKEIEKINGGLIRTSGGTFSCNKTYYNTYLLCKRCVCPEKIPFNAITLKGVMNDHFAQYHPDIKLPDYQAEFDVIKEKIK